MSINVDAGRVFGLHANVLSRYYFPPAEGSEGDEKEVAQGSEVESEEKPSESKV